MTFEEQQDQYVETASCGCWYATTVDGGYREMVCHKHAEELRKEQESGQQGQYADFLAETDSGVAHGALRFLRSGDRK